MFASQLAVNAMDQTTLNFGVTITYTPPGLSPVSFPAIVDQTALNVTDQGAVWIAHDDLELLIRMTDYSPEPVLGGQVALNGSSYQVTPKDGKYFWEWADKFQLRRRWYLKRMSA